MRIAFRGRRAEDPAARIAAALALARGQVGDLARVLLIVDARDLPAALEVAAGLLPARTVVVAPGTDGTTTGPGVTVVRTTSLRRRILALARQERFTVGVDASRDPDLTYASLRHLAYFVRDGGAYVILGAEPRHDAGSVRGLLDTLAAVTTGAAPSEARDVDVVLAAALSTALEVDGMLIMRRRGDHFVKLSEWDVEAVLSDRHGTRWGESVVALPERQFTALGEVTSHGTGPIASGRRTFEIPALHLRRYVGARASYRQVLTYEGFVLPDTFRHPHQRPLHNSQLTLATAHVAGYRDETRPTRVRQLSGSYYYLDTAFPWHFGHVTTEVLSRVWGWELARAQRPDIRAVASAKSGTLPRFQAEIFTALGIDPDAVEIIGTHEVVELEELFAATPAFENPHYVAPELADTWRRLAQNLPPADTPVRNDRIFVARRPSGKRDCLDAERVEAFFADAGFAVVFPEDHPYPAQRALFRQARIVAGFGGSGMFNIMFAPDARVVVISGDSYIAANEELIAAANGNEIHYFWGDSELKPRTPGKFDRAAFKSNFRFDLEKFAPQLRDLVR